MEILRELQNFAPRYILVCLPALSFIGNCPYNFFLYFIFFLIFLKYFFFLLSNIHFYFFFFFLTHKHKNGNITLVTKFCSSIYSRFSTSSCDNGELSL